MSNMKSSTLADDLSGAARDEIAVLREKVETLMSERVTPMMAGMADRAEHVARGAADRMNVQVDRLSSTVREQPITSLAIAGAIGFFAAMLLRR
jgi:ElaB/YqjD/DUF883 family membrane-anchored ribosome-binding protein